jgi:hypothetical protein
MVIRNQYPGHDAKLTKSFHRRAFLRRGFALAGVAFTWDCLKGLAFLGAFGLGLICDLDGLQLTQRCATLFYRRYGDERGRMWVNMRCVSLKGRSHA